MRKKNRGKARWCSRRLKTANLMEPSEKVQGFSQVLEAKGVSANCAGGLRCCECLAPGPRGRGSKRSRPPLNVASFPWQAALLRIWKALCPLAPLKKKHCIFYLQKVASSLQGDKRWGNPCPRS